MGERTLKSLRSGAKGAATHFPGLNGLRFLAAFAVMLHHTAQIRDQFGLPSTNGFEVTGILGVVFFFVLSGFLITYLLLAERERTGTVRIGLFYARRALRIWPAYYLMVFLGFEVLPRLHYFDVPGYPSVFDGQFDKRLAYYLFLSPQLASYFMNSIPFISALWSIGMEEHFYAIWPNVIKKFGDKFVPLAGLVILATVLFQEYLWAFSPPDRARWDWLFYLFRYDCMLIGGICAWLLARKRHLVEFFFRRDVQMILYLVLAERLFVDVGHCLQFGGPMRRYWLSDEIYSVLFAGIVLNVAANPRSFLKLRAPVFHSLGEISYGLYIFNWPATVFVMRTLVNWGAKDPFWTSIEMTYLCSIAATIGVSALSFYAYEKPFLRLKDRFTVIHSGSVAPGATRTGKAQALRRAA